MNFEIFGGRNAQVVFQLMYLVIFFGLFIWAGNIILKEVQGTIRMSRWLFVELPKQRRGKKMIERARKVGKVLAVNSEKGITAVCSWSILLEEIRKATKAISFELRIASSEATRAHVFKRLSGLVMGMPAEIFTFACEDEGPEYVTGTDKDIDLLFWYLVHNVTGYRRSEVNPEAFKTAVSILVVKDRRLLVPFVRGGGLSPDGTLMLSLESQISLYGRKTLEDACTYVLGLL